LHPEVTKSEQTGYFFITCILLLVLAVIAGFCEPFLKRVSGFTQCCKKGCQEQNFRLDRGLPPSFTLDGIVIISREALKGHATGQPRPSCIAQSIRMDAANFSIAAGIIPIVTSERNPYHPPPNSSPLARL